MKRLSSAELCIQMERKGKHYCTALIGNCRREASVPHGGRIPLRAWDIGLRDSDTYAAAMAGDDLRRRFNAEEAGVAWLRWTERFRRHGIFDPVMADPVEIKVDLASGIFKTTKSGQYGCLTDVESCLFERRPSGQMLPIARSSLSSAKETNLPGNKPLTRAEDESHQSADILREIADCASSYEGESATERDAIIAARLGQGRFRAAVARLWSQACAVTDCRLLGMLKASHIKPWKLSTNAERLDCHNGILLIPNLDTAFDRGYISFLDSGEICLGPQMTAAARRSMGIHRNMRLTRVPCKIRPYLFIHRKRHGFG